MNCIAKLVFASLVGAGLFAGMNVQAAQKPAAASKPGKAAIASSHQLATDAGLEILAKGGNAFDAAIAVGAALAVVEPESSGLGGGGFFLLHRVKDGKVDVRETVAHGIENAVDAFLQLFSGGNLGKMLVRL